MQSANRRGHLASLIFASIVALAGLDWLTAGPCSADVTPESALLIHVQAVSEPCLTSLTDCDELVHMTTGEGPMEFLLFFYPIWVAGDSLRISSVDTELVWPESWNLIEADLCGGWGYFYGGSLHIEWWDPPLLPDEPGSVFLLARIVLDVHGYGRIEFGDPYDNPVGLWREGEQFVTYATGFSTEAGIDCEYDSHRCAHHEFCYFGFEGQELHLAAAPGGIVEGTVEFPMEGCSQLSIDTRAEWAEAEVERIDYARALLRVTADATGLPPGIHETLIQVARPTVARCLPVVFTVSATSSVPDEQNLVVHRSWGEIKSLYRGR